MGFSLVLPFLVFLVTRLGGNAVVYGMMGATYSVFQLIGAPVLGKWSDRFGRRRILLLSQLGTLASWIVFLVALSIPVTVIVEVDRSAIGTFSLTVPLLVLFLARALDGITGGNVSVANAYLADISNDDDRAVNFGRMSVAANLGFILGPVIAGVLGATVLAERLPVLAAIAISVAATVIIVAALPESAPCERPPDADGTGVSRVFGQELRDCVDRPHVMKFGQLLRSRELAGLLVLYFLVFLAFNIFYVAFPMSAATYLEWSVTDTGIFLSVLSGLMILVQGPVLARLATRFRDESLVPFGSVLLATSFVVFASSDVTPILYVGAALLAAGNGLMWPPLQSLVSKAAPPDAQGAVQGLAGSLSSAASIMGLLLGGVLFSHVGALVFGVSGVVTFLTGVLALALIQRGSGPTRRGKIRN